MKRLVMFVGVAVVLIGVLACGVLNRDDQVPPATPVRVQNTPTEVPNSLELAPTATTAPQPTRGPELAPTATTAPQPTRDPDRPITIIVPTSTPFVDTCNKTGPTVTELHRKQWLEEEFVKNTRYPPEQSYRGSGVDLSVVSIVRVPNDLVDLGMFLGYKVTIEDKALFQGAPFYGTSKAIMGERFIWFC